MIKHLTLDIAYAPATDTVTASTLRPDGLIIFASWNPHKENLWRQGVRDWSTLETLLRNDWLHERGKHASEQRV